MNTYLKIFFILLIASVLTAVSYKFTSKGLSKYYHHKHERVIEIFTGYTKYDILFIGSSRTHTAIIPKIIDSITGLSSYNAGVDGGIMLDFKMTFDGYLLNHPSPALLVLTIDPASFNRTDTIYDPIQYFPIVGKNDAVKKVFAKMDYSTFILKYIPALSYIYMDDNSKSMALAGLWGKSEILPGEFEDKGYLSNTDNCLDPVKYRKDSSNIAPVLSRINMFQAIIDICKSKNIQLIITYAPEYRYRFEGTIRNFNTFTDLMYEKVNANRLLF